jgi:hypothetical protein
MTSQQVVPLIVLPFIAWRIYARVRRNIGRQAFHPGRMTGAIIFFSAITVLMGLGGLTYPLSLGALGGGLLLSVPLALFGLKVTKFETTPEGKFYTPHTGMGVVLTVLFLGRMAYRMFNIISDPALAAGTAQPPIFQSPMTLLIFGLTAGYYITYYVGARRRGLQLA